jgi:MerR family transcriptional regulator, light-induced transcriptional regulator
MNPLWGGYFMFSNLLTCRQASRKAGVSTSTIKRLCDEGQLAFIRTPGGHRRISAKSLIALFGHTDSVEASQPTQSQTTQSQTTQGYDSASLSASPNPCPWPEVDQLIDVLLSDHFEDAYLHFSTVREESGAAAMIDRCIGPVMWQVGRKWDANAIDIFQEHLISDRIRQFLCDLSAARYPLRSLAKEQVAVGCAAEHDHSDIPSKCIELTLRAERWSATSLGANLPAEQLVRAAISNQASLVWVSYTHPQSDASVRHGNMILRRELGPNVRIVVGGGGLSAALRKELVFDFSGDTMEHLRNYVVRHCNPSDFGAVG